MPEKDKSSVENGKHKPTAIDYINAIARGLLGDPLEFTIALTERIIEENSIIICKSASYIGHPFQGTSAALCTVQDKRHKERVKAFVDNIHEIMSSITDAENLIADQFIMLVITDPEIILGAQKDASRIKAKFEHKAMQLVIEISNMSGPEILEMMTSWLRPSRFKILSKIYSPFPIHVKLSPSPSGVIKSAAEDAVVRILAIKVNGKSHIEYESKYEYEPETLENKTKPPAPIKYECTTYDPKGDRSSGLIITCKPVLADSVPSINYNGAASHDDMMSVRLSTGALSYRPLDLSIPDLSKQKFAPINGPLVIKDLSDHHKLLSPDVVSDPKWYGNGTALDKLINSGVKVDFELEPGRARVNIHPPEGYGPLTALIALMAMLGLDWYSHHKEKALKHDITKMNNAQELINKALALVEKVDKQFSEMGIKELSSKLKEIKKQLQVLQRALDDAKYARDHTCHQREIRHDDKQKKAIRAHWLPITNDIESKIDSHQKTIKQCEHYNKAKKLNDKQLLHDLRTNPNKDQRLTDIYLLEMRAYEEYQKGNYEKAKQILADLNKIRIAKHIKLPPAAESLLIEFGISIDCAQLFNKLMEQLKNGDFSAAEATLDEIKKNTRDISSPEKDKAIKTFDVLIKINKSLKASDPDNAYKLCTENPDVVAESPDLQVFKLEMGIVNHIKKGETDEAFKEIQKLKEYPQDDDRDKFIKNAELGAYTNLYQRGLLSYNQVHKLFLESREQYTPLWLPAMDRRHAQYQAGAGFVITNLVRLTNDYENPGKGICAVQQVSRRLAVANATFPKLIPWAIHVGINGYQGLLDLDLYLDEACKRFVANTDTKAGVISSTAHVISNAVALTTLAVGLVKPNSDMFKKLQNALVITNFASQGIDFAITISTHGFNWNLLYNPLSAPSLVFNWGLKYVINLIESKWAACGRLPESRFYYAVKNVAVQTPALIQACTNAANPCFSALGGLQLATHSGQFLIDMVSGKEISAMQANARLRNMNARLRNMDVLISNGSYKRLIDSYRKEFGPGNTKYPDSKQENIQQQTLSILYNYAYIQNSFVSKDYQQTLQMTELKKIEETWYFQPSGVPVNKISDILYLRGDALLQSNPKAANYAELLDEVIRLIYLLRSEVAHLLLHIQCAHTEHFLAAAFHLIKQVEELRKKDDYTIEKNCSDILNQYAIDQQPPGYMGFLLHSPDGVNYQDETNPIVRWIWSYKFNQRSYSAKKDEILLQLCTRIIVNKESSPELIDFCWRSLPSSINGISHIVKLYQDAELKKSPITKLLNNLLELYQNLLTGEGVVDKEEIKLIVRYVKQLSLNTQYYKNNYPLVCYIKGLVALILFLTADAKGEDSLYRFKYLDIAIKHGVMPNLFTHFATALSMDEDELRISLVIYGVTRWTYVQAFNVFYYLLKLKKEFRTLEQFKILINEQGWIYYCPATELPSLRQKKGVMDDNKIDNILILLLKNVLTSAGLSVKPAAKLDDKEICRILESQKLAIQDSSANSAQRSSIGRLLVLFKSRMTTSIILSLKSFTVRNTDRDGACLFRAISYYVSVTELGPVIDTEEAKQVQLREMCCAYMLANKKDFLGFFAKNDSGANAADNEKVLASYIENIRSHNVLGGQPEIMALAKLLNRPIILLITHDDIMQDCRISFKNICEIRVYHFSTDDINPDRALFIHYYNKDEEAHYSKIDLSQDMTNSRLFYTYIVEKLRQLQDVDTPYVVKPVAPEPIVPTPEPVRLQKALSYKPVDKRQRLSMIYRSLMANDTTSTTAKADTYLNDIKEKYKINISLGEHTHGFRGIAAQIPELSDKDEGYLILKNRVIAAIKEKYKFSSESMKKLADSRTASIHRNEARIGRAELPVLAQLLRRSIVVFDKTDPLLALIYNDEILERSWPIFLYYDGLDYYQVQALDPAALVRSFTNNVAPPATKAPVLHMYNQQLPRTGVTALSVVGRLAT